MNNVFRKRRTLIVTVAVASAAVAYVIFVFLPGQKAIGRLRDEVRERREFILQSNRLVLAVQRSEEELSAARNYIQQWESAAPAEREIAQLFGTITELADNAGIVITRFDPQQPLRLETIRKVPVSLEFSGNFAQVFDFIRGVEELSANIWFDNLEIAAASNTHRGQSVSQPGRKAAASAATQQNSERLHCQVVLIVFTDNDGFSD